MKRQAKTDLGRVDAVTEGEVQRNALAEPDAEPTDAAFWADAELREPQAKRIRDRTCRKADLVRIDLVDIAITIC